MGQSGFSHFGASGQSVAHPATGWVAHLLVGRVYLREAVGRPCGANGQSDSDATDDCATAGHAVLQRSPSFGLGIWAGDGSSLRGRT